MKDHDNERCERSGPGKPGVQCPNRWTHEARFTSPKWRGEDVIRICADHAATTSAKYASAYKRIR